MFTYCVCIHTRARWYVFSRR